MKNILVIFGLNNLGYFAKHRINKMTEFIKNIEGNFYFLSFVDNKKLSKILDFSKFKDVICFKEYFSELSWKKSYNMINNLIIEKNIDRVYSIFSPVLENYKYGNEFKLEELYTITIENDSHSNNFKSMFNFCKRSMLLYYITKKCNIQLYQFVDDPLELDYCKFNINNKRYFYYNNDKNLKYFPYIEYGFIYLRNKYFNNNYSKQYDFIFGLTNIMSARSYRSNLIKELLEIEHDLKHNNLKCKYFIKDKFRKINTFINGIEYNDTYITQSKYTLIVPSYDEKEFSLIRFLEAIDRRCIPLIHKDCELSSAFQHLPEFKNIIFKYNLIIDVKDLIDKLINLPFNSIINEFIDSKDYQQFLDINYYNNFMENF